MACCGELWSAFSCLGCSSKKKGEDNTEERWQKLKEKKDAAFAFEKYKSSFLEDLRRTSLHREKAFKEGMIWPFLLLVSMPPTVRNRVANMLEIDLVAEGIFPIYVKIILITQYLQRGLRRLSR